MPHAIALLLWRSNMHDNSEGVKREYRLYVRKRLGKQQLAYAIEILQLIIARQARRY